MRRGEREREREGCVKKNINIVVEMMKWINEVKRKSREVNQLLARLPSQSFQRSELRKFRSFQVLESFW